jgi:hypothetical protein
VFSAKQFVSILVRGNGSPFNSCHEKLDVETRVL